MCGIAGIVGRSGVNQQLYDALTVLQHRGQDAAGIVTCDQGVFKQRKANGLVRDVFRSEHMQRLGGTYGIGHVRYPTAGSASSALAQPFYVNSLRHLPGAQRQPDQLGTADASRCSRPICATSTPTPTARCC